MSRYSHSGFSTQSDCVTADNKIDIGMAICNDMIDVAKRFAFNYERNIRKMWDEMLKEIIETTVF